MANYIKLAGTAGPGLNYNLGGNQDVFQFVNINRVNLVCDTTLGPINIQLPKISELDGFTNYEVIVNHTAGDATVNPITITVGDSTDNINNMSGVTLNTSYQKMHFVIASLTDWMFSQSGCCASTFHTEYFLGITAPSVVTSALIDITKPVFVIRTDASMTGATLSKSTGGNDRDYSLTDDTGTGETTITFTDVLVDADIQVMYYSTDFIEV